MLTWPGFGAGLGQLFLMSFAIVWGACWGGGGLLVAVIKRTFAGRYIGLSLAIGGLSGATWPTCVTVQAELLLQAGRLSEADRFIEGYGWEPIWFGIVIGCTVMALGLPVVLVLSQRRSEA